MSAMFRQFGKSAGKAGAGKKEDDWYFICAEWEFSDGQQTGLLLAVTDGKSAWTLKISGENFTSLVSACRIGESQLRDFVDHTSKAFANTQKATAKKEEYILEAKPGADGQTLEFKWKFRESAVSQIVGQVSLAKADVPAPVMRKMYAVVFDVTASLHSICRSLEREKNDTKEAIKMIKKLRDRPDQKDAILDRCVEIINEAKRKNRDRGGTSAGFEKAWIQGTQADVSFVEDEEMSE